MIDRTKAIKTAKELVANRFPACELALLAGSVARNEHTKTSDLDMIVFDNHVSSSFRESRYHDSWPVEWFVHSTTSFRVVFEADQQSASPTMQRMIVDGLVLVNRTHDFYERLKAESELVLQKGPDPWSSQMQKEKRYFLTDTLEDLIGEHRKRESFFIVNHLMEQLGEFVLRMNGHWIGQSKWLYRCLYAYDSHFAESFYQAFEYFYQTGRKEKVIGLTQHVLDEAGGPLFDGFSLGKNNYAT
ncbi:nucleotidyltransferase domain-containing protein [Bacillus sp. C1-1]|nr:nucleotidyltransferase domain-containing protein [Bacillus sp. C1-1]